MKIKITRSWLPWGKPKLEVKLDNNIRGKSFDFIMMDDFADSSLEKDKHFKKILKSGFVSDYNKKNIIPIGNGSFRTHKNETKK